MEQLGVDTQNARCDSCAGLLSKMKMQTLFLRQQPDCAVKLQKVELLG